MGCGCLFWRFKGEFFVVMGRWFWVCFNRDFEIC